MGQNSSIEWTNTTWNPVVGCKMVSSGCANCYAEKMTKRLAGMALADLAAKRNPGRKKNYLNVIRGGKFAGNAITVPEALTDPLGWRKPRRIFVNSMSDLFHIDVPFEFIAAVYGITDAASFIGHTMQVLTKRPERTAEFYQWVEERSADVSPLGPRWTRQASLCSRIARNGSDINYGAQIALGSGKWPIPNLWLGTSVENQATADERIPHLLKCPAAVRFLSCEPLLGPLDLSEYVPIAERVYGRQQVGIGIHWVIVGGESGPGARPMRLAWARSIVKQCREAGVSCFVKQLGGNMNDDDAIEVNRAGFTVHDKKGGDINEWPEDLRVRQFPATTLEASHV